MILSLTILLAEDGFIKNNQKRCVLCCGAATEILSKINKNIHKCQIIVS